MKKIYRIMSDIVFDDVEIEDSVRHAIKTVFCGTSAMAALINIKRLIVEPKKSSNELDGAYKRWYMCIDIECCQNWERSIFDIATELFYSSNDVARNLGIGFYYSCFPWINDVTEEWEHQKETNEKVNDMVDSTADVSAIEKALSPYGLIFNPDKDKPSIS